MRRRDFIKVVSGLAITWPHTARAQQPTMPVIGFLDSGSPEGMTANLAAFHQGLLETGYIEGQNVAVEYRWARSHFDQLPALAIELVQRKAAVIAATRGPLPARAAKAATSTIPVVFQSGSDPVGDGLVASLNRPGGNVTGASRLSTDLIPKRLGLMTEVVPKLTKIALLLNPISPQADLEVQEMQEPTRSLGLQLFIAKASAADELDEAFATVKESGSGALIVAVDPLFVSRREKIVALGLQNAIPSSFAERQSVIAGGLMSYAASFSDSFRQVGVYVGRILKGEKPADLPVWQPTKFDFVINLRTAKALGLTAPPQLLARADEVIE